MDNKKERTSKNEKAKSTTGVSWNSYSERKKIRNCKTEDLFEDKHTRKAIKTCALDKNIEAYSHWDLTKIGERGLTMSMGQKICKFFSSWKKMMSCLPIISLYCLAFSCGLCSLGNLSLIYQNLSLWSQVCIKPESKISDWKSKISSVGSYTRKNTTDKISSCL